MGMGEWVGEHAERCADRGQCQERGLSLGGRTDRSRPWSRRTRACSSRSAPVLACSLKRPSHVCLLARALLDGNTQAAPLACALLSRVLASARSVLCVVMGPGEGELASAGLRVMACRRAGVSWACGRRAQVRAGARGPVSLK